MRTYKTSPLTLILVSLPFVLWAVVGIYPSFDDWSTLSSPNFDPDCAKFFLPYGSVWRPFDALMGYIVGAAPQLFPALNHVCIVAGHLIGAVLVMKLSQRLGFCRAAQFASTLFFWMSPCMLGTVLSCDALNQTYSQMWGMAAVWFYLSAEGRRRYAAWAACVMMAALSKDNGIAWAVVPPVLAFAFGMEDRRSALRHLLFGVSVAVAYGCIRLALPSTEYYNPDYNTFLPTKKLKEIAIFLGYTWVAADYVSIVHTASRSLPLAALTLVLSLPFVYMMFVRSPRLWLTRRFLGLAVCILIVMSPHLLISLSVMNAYAGLGMSALLVAFVADHMSRNHPALLRTAFAMYAAAAIITDVHHWYKAYTTAAVGREMAHEAIRLAGHPVKNAYCVVTDDDEKKFSSFCVLPQDAFGPQAAAVVHETSYRWPTCVKDTIIPRESGHEARSIARRALDTGKYECVWLIDKSRVDIMRKDSK